MIVPFTKMHGAGNDFVIFDARNQSLTLTPLQAAHIADRRLGVGCDQIIVLETPTLTLPLKGGRSNIAADVFMRIYNPDGSESGACGNATRCVGWMLMEELGKNCATIQTVADILSCTRAGDYQVKVDMGMPKTEWGQIPLSRQMNTLHMDVGAGELGEAVAVSMGNPHAVFFTTDIADIDVAGIGAKLEHHPLFPERVNISFAEVISASPLVMPGLDLGIHQGESSPQAAKQATAGSAEAERWIPAYAGMTRGKGAAIKPAQINLRVWERGAGETLACGTAACATLVAAYRRCLTGNEADIHLPGGTLSIRWDVGGNGHVYMIGPVATSFTGSIAL